MELVGIFTDKPFNHNNNEMVLQAVKQGVETALIKQFLSHMKDNFENVQNIVDAQDIYYIMGLDKKFQKNKKG